VGNNNRTASREKAAVELEPVPVLYHRLRKNSQAPPPASSCSLSTTGSPDNSVNIPAQRECERLKSQPPRPPITAFIPRLCFNQLRL